MLMSWFYKQTNKVKQEKQDNLEQSQLITGLGLINYLLGDWTKHSNTEILTTSSPLLKLSTKYQSIIYYIVYYKY